MERLRESGTLLAAVVTVMAASPFLTRTCVTDPMALDVLAALDRPVEPLEPLSRWKALEVLRVAALDLSEQIPLETVGALLADLADGVLDAATRASGLQEELAVIDMGKLGARELNYGSDIDIVLVGRGDPQQLVALARQAWRIDLGLRPEGRSGPLVRSLSSYIAYWDRWAQTWEFQALLKARPSAGQRQLGVEFAAEASRRVWGRPLGADELRTLRAMKGRAERAVARQGLSQREIKLGRGGIRDIEFSIQLLQLVHGRQDESLRTPATLAALSALAAGGYIARPDAEGLAAAYRFLRAVEHRLQLFWDRQVHALPASAGSRAHVARVLGYRDGPTSTALASFETDLVNHQTTARAIHERLFFRPLLEAFTTRHTVPVEASAIGEGADVRSADVRGADVRCRRSWHRRAQWRRPCRTGGQCWHCREGRRRGESRPGGDSGRCGRRRPPATVSGHAQRDGHRRTPDRVRFFGRQAHTGCRFGTDPGLLTDLSPHASHGTPGPRLALRVARPGSRPAGPAPAGHRAHRRAQLNALFRESPEAARHLCILLGTSPLFAGGYEHHPEQLRLLETGPPALPGKEKLERRALETIVWRHRSEWWRGLASLQRSELLRAQARDVLGLEDVAATGRSLACLAEAVLQVALRAVAGAGGSEGRRGGDGGGGAVDGRGDGGAAGEDDSAGAGTDGDGGTGPPAPVEGLALMAMGRFGGSELAYASDLDVLVVFDDAVIPAEEAEELAEALLRLVGGETPVQRLYELDLSLRPEGRNGSLARSLKAYEGYYERWAQVWERQALTRGRFVAGDPTVGRRFGAMARHFLWGSPLSDDDVFQIRRMKARIERERVPSGEDPEFHLKLGPGSLSDVEWTVQLLQLRNEISAEGTLDALDALTSAGAIASGDARVLAESYRFCEATRNRLYLVRGRPGDALPPPGHHLTSLARSMGTTAPALREQYRRLTRRARRVTDRLFYGSD